MRPLPGARGSQPRRRPALGLLLLGTGRPEGLAQFGTDTDSYLASLAPLLGLLIVMSGIVCLDAGLARGLLFFLIPFCNLLAPPVIGHVFCAVWGKRERWPLYANVLNWSQWLMVAVVVVLLPLASFTVGAGLSVMSATLLLLGTLGVYVLWFHWFLARHALALSRARALLVMVCMVFGTGLLLHGPIWIGAATGLQPVPDLSLQDAEGVGTVANSGQR
jgi:hypothetical protein